MDTLPELANEFRTSVSVNLTKVRQARGMTLSGLAEVSGIGKATLSGIEAGRGNPTIETVWKLARTLGVPFGELIDADNEQTVESVSEGVSVRLINRQSTPRVIETYIMELAPRTKRYADSHMPGVEESVVVLKGQVLLGQSTAPVFRSTGQSYSFKSDIQHLYQSLGEPCSLMVSVIYPVLSEITLGTYDVQRDWPQTEDDWTGLKQQTDRMSLENRQGVNAVRLSFKSLPVDQSSTLSLLKHKLDLPAFSGKLGSQTFIVDEQGPMLIYLSRQGQHALLPLPKLNNPMLRQAVDLCNRSCSLWDPLGDPEIAALRELSQSKWVCLSTLAAESLTRHGYPAVPVRAAPAYEQTEIVEKSTDVVLFEDRINVDAYAAYELVHPAYAKQSVAIALHLEQVFQEQAGHILDVGTGPGLPLKMVLELMPQLDATTVDPSETAFNHLRKLFKGYDNVHSLKASITELPVPEHPYAAAISVGASHHLDTFDFLTSVRRQLKPDGIFIVSDEMICPFDDVRERKPALISHHLQYIADTLAPVPVDELVSPEASLLRAIQHSVPMALFEARTGNLGKAEYRCRNLLESLEKLALPTPSNHPLLAFYRLHFLELEALVAGLDYEVEQKTHPRCFADLACSAGFDISYHQRLYATCGRDEWEAGTHLFVLRAL
ncbi:helix-turn-helix domain-containing protein [Martelella alba]|uniref:Helix-turn-helix domain-containing protein n=1 Tax=Martelella alba TaxID=2590451 RepID=A0ABY2SF98_9HYPH|nr:helix-turn-helix domain-containing protein [Martelella alba]TKI02346.1 helix-turn-helix domain-containing protein [Martelella alba]